VLHGDDILTAAPSAQPSSRPPAPADRVPVPEAPPSTRPPVVPVAAPAAVAYDPRLAAARQRQVEANAAALAKAQAREAQHERDKARAQEALQIARQRRIDRENRDKLDAQSREAIARGEREEMEKKIAAQMEQLKVMKAAHQNRDKELLRMKQAAEEREAFARQKAREARDEPRKEQRAGAAPGGGDAGRKEPPVSFLVMGEKEPVRVAPKHAAERSPVAGASPPSEQNGRLKPRMKPSVPRQQPANYKAPQPGKQHSPPEVSPRPRLGVLERQAQAQKREAGGGDRGGDMRVDGKELKGDRGKAAGGGGSPPVVPVPTAVPGGGGPKVDMSAAQERRRKFELLKAQGAVRKQPQRRKEWVGVLDEPAGSSVADDGAEADASEVAALDDGEDSSSEEGDEEDSSVKHSQQEVSPVENDMARRRGMNVDRLKNFEQQMGVLNNIISDLSPSSNSPPSAFGIGNGQRFPARAAAANGAANLAGGSEKNKGIAAQKKPAAKEYSQPPPPVSKDPVEVAEDLLAQRRNKRNEERRNLRDFVAAQRKAKVPTLPFDSSLVYMVYEHTHTPDSMTPLLSHKFFNANNNG
jgi:hypothetical protein